MTGSSQRVVHNRNTRGENLNSADRWSDVPAGTMDEASPFRVLDACRKSYGKDASADWSAASS